MGTAIEKAWALILSGDAELLNILATTAKVSLSSSVIALLMIFAPWAVRLFSPDGGVIGFGVLFMRTNALFLLFNCVNHVLAAALRGRNDSRGPMVIMLACFVAVRQTYLYLITHFYANTPRLVGFGYPVGWMSCCLCMVSYYLWKQKRLSR